MTLILIIKHICIKTMEKADLPTSAHSLPPPLSVGTCLAWSALSPLVGLGTTLNLFPAACARL